MQIPHEARLVDRHQRAQAHRDGRELPEVGHQPGMRVGGQAVTVHLLAEVMQLLLADAPLEVGTCVDPGCRMPLEEHQITLLVVVGRAEEMVVRDVDQRRAGCEAGDMTTELARQPVGLHDHGHRIPAYEGADPTFHRAIAGKRILLGQRDGVQVGGIGAVGEVGARPAGLVDQFFEQKMRPIGAFVFEYAVQGLQPFLSFLGIEIRFRCHEPELPIRWIGAGLVHLFGVGHAGCWAASKAEQNQ